MTHADTAHDLVLGDRNADYGPPTEDFTCLAKTWSGLMGRKLHCDLTSTDVALMMTALKLNRHAHKPKADNLVDAHGYLTCLEWIESGLTAGPRPRSKDQQAQIAALQQTIEDVACGTKIACGVCGEFLPCCCEHKR